MEFRLNDTSLLKKSGEVDWEKKAIKVRAGVNKLEWIYKKDNSVSQGSDGVWLDLIDFSVSNPISYIQRDLGVSTIEAPVKKDIYGKEQVSVKVYNIGRDTLNGFFLAYTINDGLPVKQFFNERLFPYKDTLTVIFDKKADLDQSGIYNIAIFGIDNDDDFLLNDTLSITLENKIIEESINIYPNPFSDRLTIEMNSQTHMKARISLTNISGKRVIDLDREIITGENQIIINTQHLSPSLYILRINAGTTEKVYPLIKVKE